MRGGATAEIDLTPGARGATETPGTPRASGRRDAAGSRRESVQGSGGALRGCSSAVGMSLPLLTQWKACLVARFLFCGCPWWGARAASSSEEAWNLVELVQASPLLSPRKKKKRELHFVESAPSPSRVTATPQEGSLGLRLEGRGDRGQPLDWREFGLTPPQCLRSQSFRPLLIYTHPDRSPRV